MMNEAYRLLPPSRSSASALLKTLRANASIYADAAASLLTSLTSLSSSFNYGGDASGQPNVV
jgi:hypothetical protein